MLNCDENVSINMRMQTKLPNPIDNEHFLTIGVEPKSLGVMTQPDCKGNVVGGGIVK